MNLIYACVSFFFPPFIFKMAAEAVPCGDAVHANSVEGIFHSLTYGPALENDDIVKVNYLI